MDKGACNSVNSKIQTRLLCAIKSNLQNSILVHYMETHAQVHHITGITETKLWKLS